MEPGVTVAAIQERLTDAGAWFPPAPTFTGAFAGGIVATNAAGAATFKYGSTRDWVEAVTVVLADGTVLDLRRGAQRAEHGRFEIETASGRVFVPVPTYRMPDVAKRSAGYHAAPGMDLIDLFIGSEGTLGVITRDLLPNAVPGAEHRARVDSVRGRGAGTRARRRLCATRRSRRGGRAPRTESTPAPSSTWTGGRSRFSGRTARTRATTSRYPTGPSSRCSCSWSSAPGPTPRRRSSRFRRRSEARRPDSPLGQFCRLLERAGVLADTELALPHDRRRAADFLAVREAVPAGVNQRISTAKRTLDARIEKTAGDMVVPFERCGEMMAIYRQGFESRGLDYAIWGHLSDGNVHPNVIPRSYDDVVKGKEAMLEFGRHVARLGGCPLAEHGVGRNPVKQALLRQLYGDAGISEMRAVKHALDPGNRLAPGVIFPTS